MYNAQTQAMNLIKSTNDANFKAGTILKGLLYFFSSKLKLELFDASLSFEL